MATLEEVKKSFEEILKALEPSTCYLVREQRPCVVFHFLPRISLKIAALIFRKFESLISALNTLIEAAPVPAPVNPAPEPQEAAQTKESESVLLIRDGIVAAAKAARAENRSASWITWASVWKDFQAKFTVCSTFCQNSLVPNSRFCFFPSLALCAFIVALTRKLYALSGHCESLQVGQF